MGLLSFVWLCLFLNFFMSYVKLQSDFGQTQLFDTRERNSIPFSPSLESENTSEHRPLSIILDNSIKTYFLCSGILIAGQFLCFIGLTFFSSRGLPFEPSKRRLVPVFLNLLLPLIVLSGILGWYGVLRSWSFSPLNTTTYDSSCSRLMTLCLIGNGIFSIVPAFYMLLWVNFYGHGKSSMSLIQVAPTEMQPSKLRHPSVRFLHWLWYDALSQEATSSIRFDEDVDALHHASSAVLEVFRDVDVSPSDVAAGLVLLNALQRRQGLLGSTTPSHEEINPLIQHARDMHEYVKYFLGAYGSILYWWRDGFFAPLTLFRQFVYSKFSCLSGSVRSRSPVSPMDINAMLACTGLSPSEVLYCWFGNRICLPSFYVATLKSRKEIIIAIRGTTSLADCITDVYCQPAECPINGVSQPIEIPEFKKEKIEKHWPTIDTYAHSGMLKAANNVIQVLEDAGILHQIMSEFPYCGYKIVVLGHSLGAGVATLIATVLRQRYPLLASRVTALAFAPPGGLLSPVLARHASSYVKAVSFGKDIVPRLSQSTVNRLQRQLIVAISHAACVKYQILLTCCRAHKSNFLYNATEESFGDDLGVCTHASAESQALAKSLINMVPGENLPMCPPDNMLQLDKIAEKSDRFKSFGIQEREWERANWGSFLMVNSSPLSYDTLYTARRVSTEEYNQILVTTEMIRDHLPYPLIRALSRYVFQNMYLCET